MGALAACTLTPPDDEPPRPRAEVLAVEVTPASATVDAGGTLALHAIVSGTGAVPQDVAWRVDCESGCDPVWPRPGEVDAAGVYRAPVQARPDPRVVRVTAESVVAPGFAGSALVEIPSASVTLSPAQVQLFPGERVQFRAVVEGSTNHIVHWSATHGSIDENGLYVAPAHPYDVGDRVLAEAEALSNAGSSGVAAASVLLALRPPTLTGMSGKAAAGEVVTVFGSGFGPRFYATKVEVVFTDGTGGPLPVLAASIEADRVTAAVPPAAATGLLRVRLVTPGSPTATSEPVPFERLLRLRVHADRRDVAAGETARIDVAFLGGAGSFPVTFETDVGSMAGNVYTAPASLDAPGHANVKACLTGTSTCAGTTLAIHPFVVDPSPVVVPAGGSVALSVHRAGTAIPATFALGAGGGTVTSDGVFTASAAYADAGGTWLLVGDGSHVAPVPIAVTGLVPGLVARVEEDLGDPADPLRAGVPWGAAAVRLAVSGERAYVAAVPVGLTGPSWIDVYDVSDPFRLAWLGAVETAVSPQTFRVVQGRLYALSSWWDYSRYAQAFAVEVYDLSGALPVLVARMQETIPRDQEEMPPAIDDSNLYVFGPLEQTAGRQPISIYPLAEGPLPTPRTIVVPALPDALLPASPYKRTATARDGRVWITTPTVGAGWVIASWDIQADPPALLGTAPIEGFSWNVLAMNGPYLRLGWYACFDPAPPSPVEVLCASPDVLAAAEGTRYVATGEGGRLLDLSDLRAPVEVATVSAPESNGALVAGRYFAAEGAGGIAVYDLSVPGGPRSIASAPAYDFGFATGLGIEANLLYAIGSEAPYGSRSFAGAWDLGSSPPARVWTLELADPARALAVDGGLLLLASQAGLDLYGLADPAAPALVATVPLDATAVALDGPRAYVGTWDGSVVVLEVSTPTAPVELGRVMPRPGVAVRAIEMLGAGRLAVALGSAAPADADGDVVVLDVSAPAAPAVLGSAGLAEPVLDVALNGTIAAATTVSSFVVIDLTDASLPAVRGAAPLGPLPSLYEDGGGFDVVWADGLAWVSGVLGFDVRDPSWPRLVVASPSGGGLAFDGGRAFLIGRRSVAEVDLSLPRNVVRTNRAPVPTPGATTPY